MSGSPRPRHESRRAHRGKRPVRRACAVAAGLAVSTLRPCSARSGSGPSGHVSSAMPSARSRSLGRRVTGTLDHKLLASSKTVFLELCGPSYRWPDRRKRDASIYRRQRAVTNAVLTRFSSQASAPTRYAPPADQLEQSYRQPAFGGPTIPPDDVKGYGGGSGGGFGGGRSAVPTRYMTLDDVIVRTGAMLAVL